MFKQLPIIKHSSTSKVYQILNRSYNNDLVDNKNTAKKSKRSKKKQKQFDNNLANNNFISYAINKNIKVNEFLRKTPKKIILISLSRNQDKGGNKIIANKMMGKQKQKEKVSDRYSDCEGQEDRISIYKQKKSQRNEEQDFQRLFNNKTQAHKLLRRKLKKKRSKIKTQGSGNIEQIPLQISKEQFQSFLTDIKVKLLSRTSQYENNTL